MLDKIYLYFTNKNGGKGRPEYRLREFCEFLLRLIDVKLTRLCSASMVPGTIFLPIGLFLTGWTARADIHWIVPDIGIAFVGAGTILNFQSIQTYVIDTFTLHAASGKPGLGMSQIRLLTVLSQLSPL